MTTICWDGRYLASDTLGTLGDGSRCLVPCRKLLVKDGHAFGAAGRIARGHLEALADWWLADHHIDDIPAYGSGDASTVGSIVVVDPSRQIWCLSYFCPWPHQHGTPFGIGSGADYAIGHIEAGRNAMQGVACAAKHDVNTGGVIEFIDSQNLNAGVLTSARYASE